VANAASTPTVEPAPAPAAPSQINAEQQRRLAGYSPGRQELLRERLGATRAALEQAPASAYALELFVTENTDPARMERFLRRARDLVPLENLYVIPLAGAGSYRLRVVYGEFATREEALEASRHLPPRYQQAFRAAPRSFAELRGQI
jgi:septal ring-binding cell division protein DamX